MADHLSGSDGAEQPEAELNALAATLREERDRTTIHTPAIFDLPLARKVHLSEDPKFATTEGEPCRSKADTTGSLLAATTSHPRSSGGRSSADWNWVTRGHTAPRRMLPIGHAIRGLSGSTPSERFTAGARVVQCLNPARVGGVR